MIHDPWKVSDPLSRLGLENTASEIWYKASGCVVQHMHREALKAIDDQLLRLHLRDQAELHRQIESKL